MYGDSDKELNEDARFIDMPEPAAPDASTSKGDEEPSRAQVVGSVTFYCVAALVMVVLNKAVLNATQVPLFFLWTQLIIAVFLLWVSSKLGYFELPPTTRDVCGKTAPLIAINVLGLAFNTYCLQLVDASFYQVARGLVLPFTVFFSRFLLNQPSPTPAILASIFIVCLGFASGVSSEFSVSSLGIFMGVLSSLTTSVHAIFVKRSLNLIGGGTLELVWYSNFFSAIVVGPLVVLMGEMPEVWEMFADGLASIDSAEGIGSVADRSQGRDALWTFVVGSSVTGLFGFLICVAGFLSIKVTSPTSHMISSAVRGVFQTWLGVYLFNDVVSSGRAIGIVFILGGSILYTYLKSRVDSPAPPTPYVPHGPNSLPIPESNPLLRPHSPGPPLPETNKAKRISVSLSPERNKEAFGAKKA